MLSITVTVDRAITLADEKNIDIRRYDIIYQVTDDVKKAVEGLNLVHKDEVAKLQGRIDALEGELKKHESASSHHVTPSQHGV